MLRLALYGLSGVGKSTAATIIVDYCRSKNLKVEIVKLALPLYRIQKIFYETAGRSIDAFSQDQHLLEIIAGELRRISATSLVDDFIGRLRDCKTDVVINDDIRDYHVDYPVLKREGFIFIRLVCDEDIRLRRLQERNDISVVKKSATTMDLDKFKADLIATTDSSDLSVLDRQLSSFLNTQIVEVLNR
jgi:dephospho-CoA kinase